MSIGEGGEHVQTVNEDPHPRERNSEIQKLIKLQHYDSVNSVNTWLNDSADPKKRVACAIGSNLGRPLLQTSGEAKLKAIYSINK